MEDLVMIICKQDGQNHPYRNGRALLEFICNRPVCDISVSVDNHNEVKIFMAACVNENHFDKFLELSEALVLI